MVIDLDFTPRQDHESILYSFNFDPNVYEYKPGISETSSYDCSFPGFEPIQKLKKGVGSEEAWMKFQTTLTFSRMLFDPFRKILARVVLEPHSLDGVKSGEIDLESPKRPKILLFDDSYRLMAELKLDKSKSYDFTNMFVAEDGIWVQKINENEDAMCFELIAYDHELLQVAQ